MNVVLFGATGIVGAGVLNACLEDVRVESVLAVGRVPCGVSNPKLRELVRSDFFDYSDAGDDLKGPEAAMLRQFHPQISSPAILPAGPLP